MVSFGNRRKARKAVRVRPRLEALEDRLAPAVLTVGPGEEYALPSQAAAAAHDGDTIDIDSDGNYNGDTCLWTQNNLTIQGVGAGRAHIDITGQTAYGDKAIWVIDGSNTTINNIELSGAHDTLNTGHNWAGIRLEGNTLTLNNDYFHNNDDGILTAATNTTLGPTSNVAIYGCEFAANGYGDGESHNMYIGQVTSFTLENSYSHDANEGHLVKSRALTNYILYNRLEDGSATTSTASYELDLPQGGTSYVIGNLIEQGPYSANHTIISYAEEGALNPGESLYLVNNTVVNDYSGGGTFVNLPTSGTSALLENNIFCGPGTVAAGSGSVTQTTNLVSNNPGFVNQAGYDYHLTAGSPAIDASTDPGTVNGFNLTPIYEYVDPLSLQSRPVDGQPIDIGAYEYVSSSSGTSASNATAFFSTNSQDVTLTAGVTSSAGPVNEGTVTFTVMQGSTIIGTATPSGTLSNGAASVNYALPANLAAGTYTIDAVYSGGPDFQGSSDDTHTLTITPANVTTTAVKASAYYSPNQQSVTLNATLADGSFSSDTVDEGTVFFTVMNGSTKLGSGQGTVNSSGAASATVTLPAGLVPGNYTLSVSYSDSAGNFSDSGDNSNLLTVKPANVTTQAQPASAVYSLSNQTVTLNATVLDASNSNDTVDEGTVTFTVLDGSTSLGTVPGTVNNSGAASANFTLLAGQAAGNYTLSVSYSDSTGNFSDSGDTSSALVIAQAEATTVAADESAVFRPGVQNVTLTAKVSSTIGAVNEGTVTFTVMQGSTVIGTPTPSGTVSNGVASVSYALPAATAAGSYTLSVSYSDSGGNFTDSGDTNAILTVSPANVGATAVNASASYSPNTQSVTLNAVIADGSFSGDTVDEGTVTFTVAKGATTLGSVQGMVSGGKASAKFTLPAGLAAGTYALAVNYSDSQGNFTDGGDSNGTLTIAPAGVSTTVTASASTTFSPAAQTLTLSAAIDDLAGPNNAVGEGIVTFTVTNGSTILGSAAGAVNDGTANAALTLPGGLAAGNYTLAVHYSDSQGNFSGGSNSYTTLTISPAATTAQLMQASLVPTLLSLTATETLTAHVSSSTAVTQGTVTFFASGHTVTANVDGNGNATAVVTIPMLGLLGPQDIGVQYNDASNNRTPSSDSQTAAWRVFNPIVPSTATFAPNSDSVTADLFGLFITYTNGVLTEIDFGSIHLVFSYNAGGGLAQVTLDGMNLLT